MEYCQKLEKRLLNYAHYINMIISAIVFTKLRELDEHINNSSDENDQSF
jgi:hypothetical protein